jgi:hypothetical protein
MVTISFARSFVADCLAVKTRCFPLGVRAEGEMKLDRQSVSLDIVYVFSGCIFCGRSTN